MERIDLHTHTLASDGSDTPAAVVQQAAALGLRAVAVTDHDTFAGLPEALAAGQRCGIEVVPGVELSTVWGGEEVHLLGYFMDTGNAALRALMTRATDERNARNETMVQRLHDAGYPITMAELHAAFPGQTVLGRPHIAALLVQRGCIPSVSDGMRGLLGRGKAFYVPRYNIPLADSIRALRAAGGVPVVAHIFKYRFDDAQRAAMLAAPASRCAIRPIRPSRRRSRRRWPRALASRPPAARTITACASRTSPSAPAGAGCACRMRTSPGSKPLPGTNVCDTRTKSSPFLKFFRRWFRENPSAPL